MYVSLFCIVGKGNLGGKKEQEIKEHYQEKLGKLESELKQLKAALKRHQHIVKSKVMCTATYRLITKQLLLHCVFAVLQAKNDAELRHLKSSVEDLKRQKVKFHYK